MSLLPRREPADACGCRPAFVEPAGTGIDDRVELRVTADDCPEDGNLVTAPPCRATVIAALAEREADAVRVRSAGHERYYTDDAVALLLAAGRFAALAEHHDAALAATARTDPLAAAREATGRAGPVGRLVAETGLAESAERAANYETALRCHDGPTLAQSRVARQPPTGTRLLDSEPLPTGGTARRYAVDNPTSGEGKRYHLVPAEAAFGSDEFGLLDEAAESLATAGGSGPLEPARAVRRVAGPDAPVEELSAVLRKHTRGNGVLDDLFADARVSDAFVTAPAAGIPVRVVVDGEPMPTNVRLTPEGVGTLASRVRRASGRAFSRATPRVDATLSTRVGHGGEDADELRVAGVTRPLSPGTAFAFRRHGRDPWTLARLVAAGSLVPRAAALLSLAVERGATGLVAGARGAGKTTTLGALLWALPESTRTVVIEDTPELPVDALQDAGRDVQPLRVARGDSETTERSPAEALRTALRLGEGALVVGEVRGAEAATLYEAMRVGAASEAVLGTVHGDGAEAVRGRMAELGVSEAAFGATGFVLTMARTESGRRAVSLEEVRATDDGTELLRLFELGDDGDLVPTGRLGRGESDLLAGLAGPDEAYADVLLALENRTERLRALA
ncbi:MAG: ATPase, T2SS/T4P/T4SS family, partial [Halolamina sp.]